MKVIILKTALALCLSTGVTTAMAQTDQPEILRKDPSQQQPTKEQKPPADPAQPGTEPPINPSEQAPAEQQQAPDQPAGEQGGSGTMKSGKQGKSGQQGTTGEQQGGQEGITTDQKTDRPTTEGSGEPKSEPGSDTTRQSQPSDKPSTTVNVTAEQKTEITQVIRETKVAPARDIEVDIAVGVAIPRTIEVHRLPPRIIKIVPDYEGYVYFVLDDGRIVILDPDTYEVVAILA